MPKWKLVGCNLFRVERSNRWEKNDAFRAWMVYTLANHVSRSSVHLSNDSLLLRSKSRTGKTIFHLHHLDDRFKYDHHNQRFYAVVFCVGYASVLCRKRTVRVVRLIETVENASIYDPTFMTRAKKDSVLTDKRTHQLLEKVAQQRTRGSR